MHGGWANNWLVISGDVRTPPCNFSAHMDFNIKGGLRVIPAAVIRGRSGLGFCGAIYIIYTNRDRTVLKIIYINFLKKVKKNGQGSDVECLCKDDEFVLFVHPVLDHVKKRKHVPDKG